MEEKKIAKRLMLKDSHPTMVKVMKLWSLAEKLGLSISFHGQTTIVEDEGRDKNLPMLRLEDIETEEGPQEWPPTCEFKLVYDNPEYLAEQKRQLEARRAADSAKAKEAENKRQAQEAKEVRERAAALEQREREQLTKLKLKYPEG